MLAQKVACESLGEGREVNGAELELHESALHMKDLGRRNEMSPLGQEEASSSLSFGPVLHGASPSTPIFSGRGGVVETQSQKHDFSSGLQVKSGFCLPPTAEILGVLTLKPGPKATPSDLQEGGGRLAAAGQTGVAGTTRLVINTRDGGLWQAAASPKITALVKDVSGGQKMLGLYSLEFVGGTAAESQTGQVTAVLS
jgi:hypothetical protein